MTWHVEIEDFLEIETRFFLFFFCNYYLHYLKCCSDATLSHNTASQLFVGRKEL